MIWTTYGRRAKDGRKWKRWGGSEENKYESCEVVLALHSILLPSPFKKKKRQVERGRKKREVVVHGREMGGRGGGKVYKVRYLVSIIWSCSCQLPCHLGPRVGCSCMFFTHRVPRQGYCATLGTQQAYEYFIIGSSSKSEISNQSYSPSLKIKKHEIDPWLFWGVNTNEVDLFSCPSMNCLNKRVHCLTPPWLCGSLIKESLNADKTKKNIIKVMVMIWSSSDHHHHHRRRCGHLFHRWWGLAAITWMYWSCWGDGGEGDKPDTTPLWLREAWRGNTFTFFLTAKLTSLVAPV